MGLECFPVIQLARSDDNPEVCTLREFLVEKPVNLVPGAPVFRRWLSELRRKFTQFKHELAEEQRGDSRKRRGGQLNW